jgi:hypothetical protein
MGDRTGKSTELAGFYEHWIFDDTVSLSET